MSGLNHVESALYRAIVDYRYSNASTEDRESAKREAVVLAAAILDNRDAAKHFTWTRLARALRHAFTHAELNAVLNALPDGPPEVAELRETVEWAVELHEVSGAPA